MPEIRVSKKFNPLVEAQILSKEIIKAGSIKKRHPIFIPELRATYYTKKKLKGQKLLDYIQLRLDEYNKKWKGVNVHAMNNTRNRLLAKKKTRKKKVKDIII